MTDDATHEFSATATDAVNNTSACSSAASYTEDSTAPAAPTLTDTDPDSPADDNTPLVKGTAEDGSTVNLYTNATCAAPASATGTAAALTAPGLEATVPGNSTTEFARATATDAAGNTSACSGPITYVEDSGPPGNAAPVCANGSANLTVGQSQNFRTCTDADGDNLDYTIVAAPTRGTAAEAGSGATSRVTYTATSAGTDSFQVKANDGQSDSNTATITTTNTAPPPPDSDGDGVPGLQRQLPDPGGPGGERRLPTAAASFQSNFVDPPDLPGGTSAGSVQVGKNGTFSINQNVWDCTGLGPDCQVTTSVSGLVTGASIAQKKRRKKKNVRLGGSRMTVSAGTTAKIRSKLTKKGLKKLKKQKKIKATITITVTKGSQTATKKVKVTLKAPKAKKKKKR